MVMGSSTSFWKALARVVTHSYSDWLVALSWANVWMRGLLVSLLIGRVDYMAFIINSFALQNPILPVEKLRLNNRIGINF